MVEFAERVKDLQFSGIRKMFDLATEETINLGLGEPDFQPPIEAIDAVEKAMREGKNKYGPTMGIPALRDKIAERVRRYRPDVTRDNIMVTASATEGFMTTILTLIDRGDEVLVPTPGFVIYEPDVHLAGGKSIRYTLKYENNFIPDINELESLITPNTKAIIVNSPSNPTGAVLSKEDVIAMSKFAEEHGLIIISDEVYDEIVYEKKFTSFASHYDDLVLINSFSKTFAMTGWRIAYVAASEEILDRVGKVHYHTIACPPTPLQYGVLAALNDSLYYIKEMAEEFKKRRDLIYRRLQEIPGMNPLKPEGAFYAFPSYDLSMKSEDLAMEILKKGVLSAPGSAFGEAGEGHIRFSYANSRENIEKAMDIVEKYMREMQ